MRKYLPTILIVIVIILCCWLLISVRSLFGLGFGNGAGVFFAQSITVSELQTKYASVPKDGKKVKILIVPGHEPDFGGTQFNGLSERDIAVDLAKELEKLVSSNSHYEAVVTRDTERWNPLFEKYFADKWDEIVEFIANQKEDMVELVEAGKVKKVEGVHHNKAPNDVAVRLFGINKWANENDVDIAIHIHFNDYPRKQLSQAGKYEGFVIYVPETQYSNSEAAKSVAEYIYRRLAKYHAVSTLPKESEGVVEDQELIAIGSYNTSDAASILLEYGYIYEPKFSRKEVRDAIIKDMAFQTYLGIQDFFGSGNDVTLAYDSLALPYTWTEAFSGKGDYGKDVYALQMALAYLNLYPGAGNSYEECPISGTYGPCTQAALSQFQKSKGLDQTGNLGPATRDVLNKLFNQSSI